MNQKETDSYSNCKARKSFKSSKYKNSIILFSIFVLTFFLTYFITNFQIFKILNLRSIDYVSNKLNSLKKYDYEIDDELRRAKILIINIDDDFIKKIGTYPLPRKYYAFVIQLLKELNPKAIGVSVFFEEETDDDEAISEIFTEDITLASLIDEEAEIQPTKKFLKSSKQCGYINADIDFDGTLRKIKGYTALKTSQSLSKHFTLNLVEKAFPNIIFEKDNKIYLKTAQSNIPIPQDGYYLNFCNKLTEKITEYDLTEFWWKVKNNKLTNLNDYIVIVGVNSPALSNYWHSISMNNFSSNYVLAYGVLNLIKGRFFYRLPENFKILILFAGLFVLYYLLLAGIEKNLTTARAILIIFFMVFLILLPPLVFYFFHYSSGYFNYYFMLSICIIALFLSRQYLYLGSVIKLNNSLNSDLQIKLETIDKLSEVRFEAIAEIKRLNSDIRLKEQNVVNAESYIDFLTHEIKNPMVSILFYLEMIKRAIDNNLSQVNFDKYFKTIVKNINKILQIIDRLKIIAYIENKNYELNFEEINLSEILEKIKNEFYIINSPPNKLDISIYQAEPIEICADRIFIEQALINLINNSIKYSVNNDCIIKIIINKFSENDIEIMFEDFGQGLKEKNPDIIFERNFREARQKNITGKGIGLYLVKQIINLHNGEINVINKGENQGLIFRIRLKTQ